MKVFKHFMPTKTVFGRKTFLKIKEEIEQLKIDTDKIAIICGKSAIKNGYIDYLKKQFETVEVFSGVPQDPSVETAKEFKSKLQQFNPTAIIAIGGGSVLDLAKVVAGALKNEGEIEEFIGVPECFKNPTVPIVAVPTTSGSGSEVTPYAVLTNKKEWKKAPIISSYIFPVLSIDDPELTVTMPQHVTANTGIDALSHCIEAFVSKRATPISKLYSLEGIKLIGQYLPRAYGNPKDIEAREKVMLGSLFGGMAITDAGAGLVHTLAHILGVMYDVPHGLAIAMFLVPVLKFYGLAAEREIVEIGKAFGFKTENFETVLSEIESFLKFLGKPESLRSFGVSESDIGNFVSLAMAKRFLMGNLPRIPAEKDIRIIVENLIDTP
ncbi:iron-containing alcohol dehydrogenase family protein [Desulfurobacterium atlanticum]|uniref:Alcohol dehydrogenase, class IV n=1 Tax=Desulfurobacterium atlanticum TaxID=240169 RepID=A0A238YJK5_9BACT|nr:iron-containing alcohol dehydrogenase [Desulfurobacterium atlanticum]SNR70988.1 Alcohol dehydrogenase, class IV [Desulfurobacterium atlanticum]